ncbi:hypothetical protein [Streptomyces sp. JJ36]|uniref:hypothetical protein n=1 Tax=Streptomyces sp. JJ36 TaxID=2736645 RepID=UPI001F399D86|nr:hypothetical protein [Streptomyces sp. JJ36]MCF6523802.1 hypothetical protein [Streptomyces sp. JJ36]
MLVLRAVSLGLLAGSAGALLAEPRGDGPGHLRLALLTGLLIGQFLTVPLSLAGALLWSAFSSGERRRPPGVPLGTLLLGFGVLVVLQARAVLGWLDTEPPPGGVGDPDGETGVALFTGLSGGLAILLGLTVLTRRLRAHR